MFSTSLPYFIHFACSKMTEAKADGNNTDRELMLDRKGTERWNPFHQIFIKQQNWRWLHMNGESLWKNLFRVWLTSQVILSLCLSSSRHVPLIDGRGREEGKWKQRRIILICIPFIQMCSFYEEENLNNLSLLKRAQRSHRFNTREEGLASVTNNTI